LSGWFARNIEGVEEFDYSKSLDWYGLQFQTPKSKKHESDADDSEPAEDAKTPEPKKKAWVGLTTEDSSGRLVVTKVLRDSPAFQAGLNADDEILAIDDYRVTAKQFADRLKQYQPGDSVGVLIARRQRLSTLRLVLGEEPAKTWKLSVVEKPTDDQKQRLADWLHQK
jgi:predicted metalloprotease with PDZ domain